MTQIMNDEVHVMIDIETLGTRPDAVVLSVGAVAFRPFATAGEFVLVEKAEFHRFLDIDEQVRDGRTIDVDTIKFWLHNKGTLVSILLEEKSSQFDMLSGLRQFLEVYKPKRLWARGPQFDQVILENMISANNLPPLWEYWRWMDMRTLVRISDAVICEDDASAIRQMTGPRVKHDALDDAKNQAILTARYLKYLQVQMPQRVKDDESQTTIVWEGPST